MKQVRAIVLILFVGGCSFFVAYRLTHPWPTPEPQASPQTTGAQCDQSLWEYVYNPGRLQVLDLCISVTGTVEEIRKEADGDVHILFRLDQQFESLLNEKNVARQYGDLVLEPICQGKVRQADAAEPCSRYPAPILNRRSAAISFLQDQAATFNEKFTVHFTKLDGTTATISNQSSREANGNYHGQEGQEGGQG